mmetsp:Transcript_8692/g.26058  ORF Transcript_8692/g.26058 Transcript_8692/m.26058 type:complete len:243 (-) Transcript_8692:618-1346(-)
MSFLGGGGGRRAGALQWGSARWRSWSLQRSTVDSRGMYLSKPCIEACYASRTAKSVYPWPQQHLVRSHSPHQCPNVCIFRCGSAIMPLRTQLGQQALLQVSCCLDEIRLQGCSILQLPGCKQLQVCHPVIVPPFMCQCGSLAAGAGCCQTGQKCIKRSQLRAGCMLQRSLSGGGWVGKHHARVQLDHVAGQEYPSVVSISCQLPCGCRLGKETYQCGNTPLLDVVRCRLKKHAAVGKKLQKS